MQELMTKLSAMLTLLSDMIRISADKKELIIKGDAEGLEKLLREETAFLVKMQRLEEERQRAAMLVAIDKGIPPMNVTMSALIAKASPAEALLLGRLQKDLFEKMGELERLNGINRVLLQTQIDVTHYMLEGATRPTQLGVQYSGAGRDTDMLEPVNLFDRQA